MANKLLRLQDSGDNCYVDSIPYSTDEVRIGTWIDGKPIYRRYAVFNNCTLESYTGLSSWNIDTMVNYTVYVYMPNDLDAFIKCPYYIASNNLCFAYWSPVTKQWRHKTTPHTSQRVIFEYTKTTD